MAAVDGSGLHACRAELAFRRSSLTVQSTHGATGVVQAPRNRIAACGADHTAGILGGTIRPRPRPATPGSRVGESDSLGDGADMRFVPDARGASKYWWCCLQRRLVEF